MDDDLSGNRRKRGDHNNNNNQECTNEFGFASSAVVAAV
jgi:hypothetical protein